MQTQNVDWNQRVKRLLKAEMVRRGFSTDDLVKCLKTMGIETTKSSIESKISRGSFGAAFFIQCFQAMGCNKIAIDIES